MTSPADTALAYLAALSAGDVDAICALVTEDFHNDHTSARASQLRGREAYRRQLPIFLAAFVGLHYEPEAVIADGDKVAVPYVMTARYVGDGAPDGGADIRLRGCVVLTIADGLVARRTEYWDSEQFARQLVEPDETSPS